MATQPDTPIKGSWEDLLETAEALGANYNDEAIPIYKKLVTRLGKMPAARRHAAGDRLQGIYRQSATGLLELSLMREHYDDALDVLEILAIESDDEERLSWQGMRRTVLVQAGQPDVTLAELRSIAEDANADLDDWYRIASLQGQLKRYDDVASTIGEMEQWVATRYGDDHPEARSRDEALLEIGRSMHQMGVQSWQSGIEHYFQAIELDPDRRNVLPELYLDFLMQGQYESAIPLIRRDQRSQVRPNFWLGYAFHMAGDKEAAERHWTKATEADLENPDNRQYVEYLLSAFYLEEQRDGALSVVLNILKEDENRQWPLFFLAGLGWALREDVASARTNMETALLHCRAMIDGRLIPYEFWIHVEVLASNEMQAELAPYFFTTADGLSGSNAAPTKGRTTNE